MKKKLFVLGALFFFTQGLARTPNESLYRAAASGDYEWVKREVEKYHADINFQNSRCKTPLVKTCERGHARVAQYLLLKKNKAGKRYVDYNAVDDKCETALHKASRKGKALVVKMLFQAGADRTIKNKDGLTALDMAKNRHKKEVIKLFGQKIKTIDQVEKEQREKAKAKKKTQKKGKTGEQKEKEKKIKKRFKKLKGREVKLSSKKNTVKRVN